MSKYPITKYWEFLAVVVVVQVLGKYMIIGHMDP